MSGRSAGDPWQRYADALGHLHAARAAVVRGRAGELARQAARQETVTELAAEVALGRERLAEIATDLRAPLAPGDLTPLPGAPPLPWDDGAADARARLAAADAAVVEARRVARLPQLLPQWSSQLARAAMVYLGFTVPAIVLVALTFQVKGNQSLFLFFVVGWPLVTAIGGAIVLSRVSLPRERPDEAERLLTRLRPPRAHPWLGVLIALLATYLTQQLLETLFGAP